MNQRLDGQRGDAGGSARRRPGRAALSAAAGVLLLLALSSSAAFAHGVADRDGAFLATNQGAALGAYTYLGAKHMVTGYDHLLFLAGVIFFLYRLRDVVTYVTLFAVGHSVTLLVGVLGGIHANPYLIDAVIGFSVAYKGFDNLGGLRAFGLRVDSRAAVLVFGLFHGFGLATKIQSETISQEGLVGNIVAFNVGVEIGQILGLTFLLLLFNAWRASGRFARHAFLANSALIVAGFVLVGHQLVGYFSS